MNSEKERVIEHLISSGYLRSSRVIEAFRKVARENFVPENLREHAYCDMPLPIPGNQTISAMHMVAVMTEHLGVHDRQKILEIGTGSGYQAAILAELNPNGEIHTVEAVPELVDFAGKNLKKYENVSIHAGDGSLGLEKCGPFDRIIATCGCPEIPKPWVEQLKDGGKIVAPVGGFYEQKLVSAEKKGNKIIEQDLNFPCIFVPLRGKYGWK